MNHEQFLKKVAMLRHFQKAYQATDSKTAMRECRVLEREIDAEIERSGTEVRPVLMSHPGTSLFE